MLLTACGAHEAVEPGPSKGVTDQAFDWERPLVPGDSGNRNWFKVLTFNSTKSLNDTTKWLTWAISRYGHVKSGIEMMDLTMVSIDHCTLRCFERRVEHLNEREQGVTRESHLAIPLADIDLQLRVPEASSEYIRFDLTKNTEISRRYLEHGQDKGSRIEPEGDILLPIRNEDHICERIVWALVHASRLCGAKVKTQFGRE
jgi:hypothetical protein